MVWPESLAKSTLHASINGRANVAPLPFNVSAYAGTAEKISALAAVAITASDFLDFINFLHGIRLVWGT
jgi:hypothetical protein